MSLLPQLIINSLIAAAVYTLLVLGFNLIYGATKFFNLAHGIMAVIGAYATLYFFQYLGINIYLSILLGIFSAGLCGYLLDKLVFLKLRQKKASALIMLVASLGAFTAIEAIISILFGSQFQTLSGAFPNQPIYTIFGASITAVQVWSVILALVCGLFLELLIKFSKFGKAVVAVSDDEEVAKIVGINTNKITGQVFFIGSSLAGLAGILIGLDTGIQPIIGMNLLLKGIIASIIGGVGKTFAGAFGALILGLIENFGIWKISGEWKDAIAFLVLILFLIFRPQGLFKK